jgi:hypothetical protein
MLTWCTPGRTSFGLLTVSHSTGAVMYVSLSVVMLTRLRYFLSVLQVYLPSYNYNSILLLLLLFQPTPTSVTSSPCCADVAVVRVAPLPHDAGREPLESR